MEVTKKAVEKSSDFLKAFRWVLNVQVHELIFTIWVFIVWTISANTEGAIFLHALLCTLAYIPIMSEAIMLFSEDNGWSNHLSRRHKHWLHGLVLGASGVLTLVGIVIEIIARNDAGKEHFGHTHSILGLISMILCVTASFGGLAAANVKSFQKMLSPNLIKFGHISIGLVGYITGMISIFFAFDKKSIALWTSEGQQTAGKIATMFVCVYVSCYSLRSLFNKSKSLLK